MAVLSGTTTTLEAVNKMLRDVGEQPVNSVGVSLSESFLAQQVLEEVSRDVQGEGLWCNTIHDFEIVPVADEIIVPDDTLHIDPTSENYVQRGTKLFDVDNRTFTITQPVRVTLVVKLDFEDLPQQIKKYIVVRASRIFYRQMIGKTAEYDASLKEELEAKAEFRRNESKTGDHSIFQSLTVGAVVRREHVGRNRILR